MAVDLVLAMHRFPSGELIAEGTVFTFPTATSGKSFNVGEFQGRDVLAGYFNTSGGGDSGKIQIFKPGSGTARAIISKWNDTTQIVTGTWDGRMLRAIQNRASTNADLVRHVHLDHNSPLWQLQFSSSLNDANYHGIGHEGRSYGIIDDSAATDTLDLWRDAVGSGYQEIALEASSQDAKGVVFTGRSWVIVRNVGSTDYRLIFKRRFGETLTNIAQRAPSGFLSVDDISFDGRLLYVFWHSGSSGSGLGGIDL